MIWSSESFITKVTSLRAFVNACQRIAQDIIDYDFNDPEDDHSIFGNLSELHDAIEDRWSDLNYVDIGPNPVARRLKDFFDDPDAFKDLHSTAPASLRLGS